MDSTSNTRPNERSTCILCNGSNHTSLYSVKTKTDGFYRKNYNLVKCNDCGLVFLSPMPTIEVLHSAYQVYHSEEINLDEVACSIENRDKKVKALAKLTGKERGKVLDIGCGLGIDLAAFKKIGWDPYGVELSEYAAKFAKENLSLNIYNGELTHANFPKENFDLIILYHSFEHLSEPLIHMQEIRRVLNKNGLLVIAVPNIESLEARIFGSFWEMGLDVPMHLYHYSPGSLTKMLSEARFTVEGIKYFSGTHCFSSSIGGLIKRIPIGHNSRSIGSDLDLPASSGKLNKDDVLGFSKQSNMHNQMLCLYRFFIKLLDLLLFPVTYVFDKLRIGSVIIVYAKPCEK